MPNFSCRQPKGWAALVAVILSVVFLALYIAVARRQGADVRSGLLRVRAQRLYSVVDLPRVESRTVTLRFQPGITGYSFTFG